MKNRSLSALVDEINRRRSLDFGELDCVLLRLVADLIEHIGGLPVVDSSPAVRELQPWLKHQHRAAFYRQVQLLREDTSSNIRRRRCLEAGCRQLGILPALTLHESPRQSTHQDDRRKVA